MFGELTATKVVDRNEVNQAPLVNRSAMTR
jgi:hypothetical protein